ncbi:MAG: YeeE/YedE family protein [Campylobacterota bacterium]|nr:YeeE/YedE family protein [Campylobacterota bacterium]
MLDINENLLFTILSLAIGFSYGIIAQRKQFCFSGGIKDLILFKHTRRTASLIVAIATAIIFTQITAYNYEIDLTQTRYYLNVNYIFIIIGGLMFGYGMMVSDGCSSRHLIKLAQRDKDSFFVLLALGLFAYFTYTLISYYSDIINSTLSLTWATSIEGVAVPYYAVGLILFYLLYLSLKKCMNIFQCWDGFLIGLLIAFVWFCTAVVSDYLFLDVSTQSLSFVYPIGRSVQYLHNSLDSTYVIFSMWIVAGVLLGAFISSLFNPQYSKKLQCDSSQQNPPKLAQKVFGGAMMGIGGILTVGCTVGQGLSGLSTLSLASFLAITSIYISAYLTAKWMHKNNALIACFVFDFKC